MERRKQSQGKLSFSMTVKCNQPWTERKTYGELINLDSGSPGCDKMPHLVNQDNGRKYSNKRQKRIDHASPSFWERACNNSLGE